MNSLKKDVTFIYMDTSERAIYDALAKEAEEKLAEKRAEKAAESAGKLELTFTGSSVESITQIMTERMMSANKSVLTTSGFDMKA